MKMNYKVQKMRDRFFRLQEKYRGVGLEVECVYMSKDLINDCNLEIRGILTVSAEDITFAGIKIIEVTGKNYFEVGLT